jgi:hypothetical protein
MSLIIEKQKIKDLDIGIKVDLIVLMEHRDPFIEAYHNFKESIDFSKTGILPDQENMVCYLLMGVPRVPADSDPTPEASVEAIDQRISILKAVFIELNRGASDEFLDFGLDIYDKAGEEAKLILEENSQDDFENPK